LPACDPSRAFDSRSTPRLRRLLHTSAARSPSVRRRPPPSAATCTSSAPSAARLPPCTTAPLIAARALLRIPARIAAIAAPPVRARSPSRRRRRPYISCAAAVYRPCACTTPSSPAPAPPCHSRTTIPPPLHLHRAAAHAHCTALTHSRRAASLFLSVVAMGRDKRKGKEVVVEEPARKRTRAAREAERAEMVAKAAEEQASGRARPFAIRDTPARGRGRGRGMGRVRGARATRATAAAAAESEQSPSAAESDSDSETEQSEQSQGQDTQQSPALRRSGRTRQTSPAEDTSPATERHTGPRTRGGHQPQEPRRSTAAAAAARRAEALAAERAVFRMDTVVRLEPGVLLQNLTKANAAKVKRLRWSVQEEEWFPVTRDSRVDRRF
jgi:hypothetical protein